jgi:hypothetical protein
LLIGFEFDQRPSRRPAERDCAPRMIPRIALGRGRARRRLRLERWCFVEERVFPAAILVIGLRVERP